MSPAVKAALHVHSTYSDGELSLAALRKIYLALGCRIVCMTDHAEAFGVRSLQAYVAECEALSDEDLQFLAGLDGRTRLPPDGALAARTVARFARTRAATQGVRHVARVASRLAERFGVPIPRPVRAGARRML
jgi:hypothetical protein